MNLLCYAQSLKIFTKLGSKNMAKTNEKPNIFVFGHKPKDALILPEIPIGVRNNCQSGKWFIGDTEYGSKLSMTIIKFSKFFGSLGQTNNALWGQLWFVAESGELPQGVVFVTYIKGRTLSDFNRKVTEIMARGIEPAEGIFIPDFIKHTGQKPDDKGIIKPINYYSLTWDWKERNDWQMLEQVAGLLADPINQSRLIDLEGTRQMVCLDHLAPHELASLMANQSYGSNGKAEMLLPGELQEIDSDLKKASLVN